MQKIGKFVNVMNEIYLLYKDGKFNRDKDYKVDITLFKGEKTDKQRSRYWAMLREYSLACREPQTEIHNLVLNDLGYLKVEAKIVKCDDGEEKIEYTPKKTKKPKNYNYLKDNREHLKPTGKFIDENGEELEIYYVLQNSEEFNTQQYSELIDYLINRIIDTGYEDRVDVNYEK